MERCVEREWLDELPTSDPRAIGSRRDLKRLNLCMGNVRTLTRALDSVQSRKPLRLAELGAGDGNFLLRVAHRLGRSWRGTQATLVDLHDVVTAQTTRSFVDLGWHTELAVSDAFDWCRNASRAGSEVIVANLFLHHFGRGELQTLLCQIEQRSCFFAAVEPRRSRLALIFSKLVGFIGCNAVTRHDAPASVRAGFVGCELSSLWPGNGAWVLRETRVGPFSHLFVANKREVHTNALRA